VSGDGCAATLNPRKVCALACHLQSPVEYVHVDLAKGEHRGPQFLAPNPNGKVLVLEAENEAIWEAKVSCPRRCCVGR
jgi:glutathione S-transferase